MAYGYNNAGLRTSTAATIEGVADYVDEYAYDCEGRLVVIAQYGAAGGSAVADKQISLAYNDQGLLATVTRYTDGNLAVLAQYSYDSAGRLATLVYSQGETILASYAWTYDTAADSVPSSSDQPSTITPQTSLHRLPSGGLMPGQDTGAIVNALWEGTGTPASLITEITSLDGTVSYSYDSAGQLLAATYTAGQASEVYSYDAAGNRVTANGTAYLTGPNNQLLFDGVYSYSYDPEGNRTARFIDVNANGLLDAGDTDATTYAWDHRNRLTRVTDYDLYGDPATRAVDYLYDTENRWIGRDVDLDADGQIDTCTRFAYDGNRIVLQFDRALAPTDDPADPLTQEHLSHRYLWNPAAVDQLMADEQVTDPDVAGDIVWPLGDHQGTIRDLAVYDPATDTTTVANHRTFDAYGNLQSQTSATVDCLFAYTGRPLDQATGLQNNLHRWYDPAVGRWMNEDPVGFEGRDGNPYSYVGNNPTNALDPSGLITWEAIEDAVKDALGVTGTGKPMVFRVGPEWYETTLDAKAGWENFSSWIEITEGMRVSAADKVLRGLYRLTWWLPPVGAATANREVYSAYDIYSSTTRVAVVDVLSQEETYYEGCCYNRAIEVESYYDASGTQKWKVSWIVQPTHWVVTYVKLFETVTLIDGPPSDVLSEDLLNIYAMKEAAKRLNPLVGVTLAAYNALIESLEGSSNLLWVKCFQTQAKVVGAEWRDVGHGETNSETFDTEAEAFAFAALLED